EPAAHGALDAPRARGRPAPPRPSHRRPRGAHRPRRPGQPRATADAAVTNSAPVSLACPVCGAAAVAGDRFCEACGADLPGADQHTQDPDAAAEAAPVVEDAAPAPVAALCPSCGADGTHFVDGYCDICGMKQPA